MVKAKQKLGLGVSKNRKGPRVKKYVGNKN